MANSVNTNSGALAALSSLRMNTGNLDRITKRVETGYRIADTADDAAIFSIAQGVRADVKAYASVQASLSAGVGLGEVALAGIARIQDLVGDIQGRIANLADGSLSTTQQDVYRADIVKLIEQVNQVIAQADFNGKNLLAGDARAAPLSFVADVNGITLSYSTPHQLDWDSDQFLGPNALFPDATDVYENVHENPPDTATALVGLNAFKARLDEMTYTVAAQKRAMEQQKDFVDNLVEALKGGLGALVDADIAGESAALESGKVSQQLSVQALSIANQRPSVLLQLLR